MWRQCFCWLFKILVLLFSLVLGVACVYYEWSASYQFRAVIKHLKPISHVPLQKDLCGWGAQPQLWAFSSQPSSYSPWEPLRPPPGTRVMWKWKRAIRLSHFQDLPVKHMDQWSRQDSWRDFLSSTTQGFLPSTPSLVNWLWQSCCCLHGQPALVDFCQEFGGENRANLGKNTTYCHYGFVGFFFFGSTGVWTQDLRFVM
jgi:hypothetical protein